MENTQTQTQTQTPNQVKDPRAEFFKVLEVGKYKVYHRSRAVSLLELGIRVNYYRPITLDNALAIDHNRLVDWIIYDKEFNKAVSQALKSYHIDWQKMRKKIYTYYEDYGKDWVLFCYKNRRVCVQIAALGEIWPANNIVVNVYYY